MKTCDRIRPLVGARVDGTATEAELAALRDHLAECPRCAREVRELVRVRQLVSDLPTLRPPPGFLPATMERVRTQHVGWFERLFGGMRPTEFRLAATVALVLVLCIGVGMVALHGPGSVVPTKSVVVKATQPHPPAPVAAPSAAPTDDYLQACRLVHGTLDQDRAFWGADAVQLASYARQAGAP